MNLLRRHPDVLHKLLSSTPATAAAAAAVKMEMEMLDSEQQ
jgi:hypothetical protein